MGFAHNAMGGSWREKVQSGVDSGLDRGMDSEGSY
jgi:hypothetical protein